MEFMELMRATLLDFTASLLLWFKLSSSSSSDEPEESPEAKRATKLPLSFGAAPLSRKKFWLEALLLRSSARGGGVLKRELCV